MAVITVAMIEQMLLDPLFDAEGRKDLPRSAESEAAAVEVFAETNSENDSTPLSVPSWTT